MSTAIVVARDAYVYDMHASPNGTGTHTHAHMYSYTNTDAIEKKDVPLDIVGMLWDVYARELLEQQGLVTRCATPLTPLWTTFETFGSDAGALASPRQTGESLAKLLLLVGKMPAHARQAYVLQLVEQFLRSHHPHLLSRAEQLVDALSETSAEETSARDNKRQRLGGASRAQQSNVVYKYTRGARREQLRALASDLAIVAAEAVEEEAAAVRREVRDACGSNAVKLAWRALCRIHDARIVIPNKLSSTFAVGAPCFWQENTREPCRLGEVQRAARLMYGEDEAALVAERVKSCAADDWYRFIHSLNDQMERAVYAAIHAVLPYEVVTMLYLYDYPCHACRPFTLGVMRRLRCGLFHPELADPAMLSSSDLMSALLYHRTLHPKFRLVPAARRLEMLKRVAADVIRDSVRSIDAFVDDELPRLAERLRSEGYVDGGADVVTHTHNVTIPTHGAGCRRHMSKLLLERHGCDDGSPLPRRCRCRSRSRVCTAFGAYRRSALRDLTAVREHWQKAGVVYTNVMCV